MAQDDFVVSVDSWEQQRYRPLQGVWLSPIQTPKFSDISGTREVRSSNDGGEGMGLPMAVCPAGWEWEGEWSVDKSVPFAFGSCDEDGWSYAHSFDALFNDSLKKVLTGEMGRLSLVRRRRWIRTRRTATAAAKRHFQHLIFLNQSLRQRLDMVSSSKESDFAVLVQFENKRRVQFEEAISLADTVLYETIAMLEGVGEKLGSMKSFLEERGRIERTYAKQLEQLASKWKYAGQPHAYMPPADGSPPPNAGFFYVVSSANQVFSSCLGDFASLLDGSLPLDVEGIIQEVSAVRNDCSIEGPTLRTNLRKKEEILQRSLAGYKQVFQMSRVMSATEGARLQSSLYSGSASDESNGGGGGDGGGTSTSTTSTSSTTTSVTSPLDAGQKMDVWQAMQRYIRACSEADAELHVFCAFATQQRKVARMTGSRVAALLQSTVKVFAHEQCRAFEDGVTELRKVGSRIPSQAGGSPSISKTGNEGNPSVGADDDLMGLINPALPAIPTGCGSVAKTGILSCAVSSLPPALSRRLSQSSSASGTPGGTNSGSSSSSKAPPSFADEYQWVKLAAVVTFDGTLLLYDHQPHTADVDDEDDNTNSSPNSSPSPPLAWTLDVDPVATVDLNQAEVEPLLLLGLDAFVVKPRSLAFMGSAGGGAASPSASTPSSASAPLSLALLAESSEDAKEWMRILTSPMADPLWDPNP